MSGSERERLKLMAGGVRGQALAVGPATRGAESGAAQSDRADIAQRAGAIGVSRQTTPVAGTARRRGQEAAAGEASQVSTEREAEQQKTTNQGDILSWVI